MKKGKAVAVGDEIKCESIAELKRIAFDELGLESMEIHDDNTCEFARSLGECTCEPIVIVKGMDA